MKLNELPALLLGTFKETRSVARDLFAILIPVIVVVKILQETGVIQLMASLLQPLMAVFGLPGEMAIVWTTAIVTNIYGAIAVLTMVAGDLQLSVAQVTVLSTMILVCHSLPIELALTHRVGCHWGFLGPLRFFGGCIAGYLLHVIYSVFGLNSAEAVIIWSVQQGDDSLWGWILAQLYTLSLIALVLYSLLLMIRIFELTGVNTLLGRILRPLLLLMGVSPQGASIAVFGLLAGITFGSGLLLAEVKRNTIPARDVVLVLAFLSLCHAIIEDTALMLLLGADLSGVLVFRLLFSIAVITAMAKLPVVDYRKLYTR